MDAGKEIERILYVTPNQFIVYPVYPNQFNPRKNIEFELINEQIVIYNYLIYRE